MSRKFNTYKSFPDLCREITRCIDALSAVLDREIVHLDQAGKPQFYSLLRRRSPQQFIAFDLLALNGKDLRSKPLLERKRLLRQIIPEASPCVLCKRLVSTAFSNAG